MNSHWGRRARDEPAPVGPPDTIASRPRTAWISWGWIALAAGLCSLAWVLFELDLNGLYVSLMPGVNSLSLAMALLLVSMWPLIAGIRGLLRRAAAGVRQRWVLRVVMVFGWLTAIACTGALLLLAGLALLLTPTASYVVKSPDDNRRVLVVNRSFLLLGSYSVYEPRFWPVYSEKNRISTDDGFDPFRNGQYRATWTDAGLELDFVFDSLRPEGFHNEFIRIPSENPASQEPSGTGPATVSRQGAAAGKFQWRSA